jgi:very-short-patch-repair endonuclease
MRRLLEVRSVGYVPVESALEQRFLELCQRAGLLGFERQVPLGDEELVGRVDYVHRRCRLVVEIDSDRHHTSLLDRKADERRDRRLTELGYTVLRFREAQIWYDADAVVQRVRAAVLAA